MIKYAESVVNFFRCNVQVEYDDEVSTTTFSMNPRKNYADFFKSYTCAELDVFATSTFTTKGLRDYMEDYVFVSTDGKLVGIFDGHGGPLVSEYAAGKMQEYFLDYLGGYGSCVSEKVAMKALRNTALRIDREVLSQSQWAETGSTVVVIYLVHTQDEVKIVSLNVGDSRSVLARGGDACYLTEDHKPNSIEERSRIEKLGGKVTCEKSDGCYRVNGILSVSRSIGDAALRPFVCATPVVACCPSCPSDQFIITASDGLWDVITTQQAVTFVQQVSEFMKMYAFCFLNPPILPKRMKKWKDFATELKTEIGKFAVSESAATQAENASRKYDLPPEVANAIISCRDKRDVLKIMRDVIVRLLAEDAIRRGSCDNISIVIQWLVD